MHKRLIHIMVMAFVLISFCSSYGRTVMAWVAACDIDDSRYSLQRYYGIKDAVTIIGLQWWLPTGSGGIKYSDDFDPNDTTIMPPDDKAVAWFRKFADQNGLKLYLCLYNCLDNNGTPFWDWALAKTAFSSANASKTITALVNEMERLKLDGIDIDLESPGTESGDQSAFASFISNLVTAVHAKNKEVSVCTYASSQFSPGTDWWGNFKGKVDHIMCMAYEWAGVSGSITYSGLVSQGGFANDVLCLGVNSDGTQSQSWQGSTAQQNLQGIYNLSSAGLCIWTSACKGGGTWYETSTWDIVKKISNKTVVVDTVRASPNLIPLLKFSGNADPASSCEVSVVNNIVNAKPTQGGSIDNGYFANFKGEYAGTLDSVKWIKVTYTSTRPIAIELYQKELDETGECFQIYLQKATTYTTAVVNVNTFYQPWWGETTQNLDMKKVTGLLFDPLLEGIGNTTVAIKEIVCYGRSSWNTPIISQEKKPSLHSSLAVSVHGKNLVFAVPADGRYTISMYWGNGRIVKNIDMKFIARGSHTIEDATRGLSKGFYYIRLSGNAGIKVSPVVVK